MDDGKRTPKQKWVYCVVGLPLLTLALIVGYRWSAPDWGTAGHRLVTTPYTLIALVIFINYLLLRPLPDSGRANWRSLRISFYWLATGSIGCIAVLGFHIFESRWIEAITDGILIVVSAASLGDGAQRLIAALAPTQRSPLGK